ncbi:MAG: hypothetical protein HQ595_03000 [Candidatus Omnitrophica bacterium]|nr:hypothetical protein [Candidatus Omnitrophota bacterium]
MKKVAILVQSKDSHVSVERLRELGVLHVEHKQLPKGDNVSALKEDLNLIDSCIRTLFQEEFSSKTITPDAQELSDWKFTARHIVDLGKRVNQLKDYAFTLTNRISSWGSWGDFQPESIQGLKDKGVLIRLYQIPVKEIKNLPQTVVVKKLAVIRGIANCVLISRRDYKLPFKEIALPEMGLNQMRSRLSEDERTMAAIKAEIRQAQCYHQSFLRSKRLLEEDLEFQQALSGMGRSSSLSYLAGYIPNDAQGLLQETAKREHWGITIKDPGEKDQVPTLIRNGRWISIIKPVFKLIELVPGYKELDISLCFLVFFSIFFGMLIGDAGIGLIFAGLTLFAQRKWSKKLKDQSLFVLFYISSACAVLWGALTGTFFGQEWLAPWFEPLIPALRNDKTIQSLCFLLGAVHLSIAHAWRGMLKLPHVTALAEVGWIAILWGAFFLARMLVLAETLPAFTKWLFIGGMSLIIFFTNPSRNLLKGIGAGLAGLLSNVVNSFTDVVSYVRLFAVGLATVAVADAFNKMAMEVGFSSITASVIAALILIVGHSLNILLAPMSILVHGVRLNVLEFCNHIDIKWSGFAYKPLKRGS